ncbi:hypothetical protein LX36DRAFT_390556 [Colletotrichum falcatum]|nr:hypothetical protein LX36DRAFT_390556 [Colletotrichum falcatum]
MTSARFVDGRVVFPGGQDRAVRVTRDPRGGTHRSRDPSSHFSPAMTHQKKHAQLRARPSLMASVTPPQVMRDGLTRKVAPMNLVVFHCSVPGETNLWTCISRLCFPLVMIRGTRDCADKTKTKRPQPDATATAASYTKERLQTPPPLRVPVGLEDQAACHHEKLFKESRSKEVASFG